MNKDFKVVVSEYGNSISEEELKWLSMKLSDRFSGDLADVLNMLNKNRRIDSFLSAAAGADELFDLCDQIAEIFKDLCDKKGIAA